MFSFLKAKIRRIFNRLVSGDYVIAPAAVAVDRTQITQQSLPPATAVAGFLQRIERPTNFHLAARLASVSHLNTKAGKIACSRQRPDARSKQMPKLQPRVPKRNAAAGRNQRVAIAAMPLVQPNVITLTQPTARCVPLDIRTARAA